MTVREVMCSSCGAKAPVLEASQRSYACPYCGSQSFVGWPPPDPQWVEPQDRRAFRRRPSRASFFLVVGVFFFVLVFVVVNRTGRSASGPRRPASGLAACASFSGEANRATWQGCPDEVTRIVVCQPTFAGFAPSVGALPAGFDDLTCDCLRDGDKRWFFKASADTPPPLASREDAERVATASCRMW